MLRGVHKFKGLLKDMSFLYKNKKLGFSDLKPSSNYLKLII